MMTIILPTVTTTHGIRSVKFDKKKLSLAYVSDIMVSTLDDDVLLVRNILRVTVGA